MSDAQHENAPGSLAVSLDRVFTPDEFRIGLEDDGGQFSGSPLIWLKADGLRLAAPESATLHRQATTAEPFDSAA
jgi:hypothetical protein